MLAEITGAVCNNLEGSLRRVLVTSDRVLDSARPRLTEGEQTGLASASHVARRMLSIIHNLQQSASIRQDAEWSVVDCSALVEAATHELADLLRDTGAQVRWTKLPKLRTIESALRFVFRELIVNAINYRSADPAVVEIRALRFDCTWQFSIDDNGIGIDRQHWESAFKPFFTVDSRSWRPGLGLTVCQLAVEQMRGSLRLEDSTRGGCCFRLTLPDSAVPSR